MVANVKGMITDMRRTKEMGSGDLYPNCYAPIGEPNILDFPEDDDDWDDDDDPIGSP